MMAVLTISVSGPITIFSINLDQTLKDSNSLDLLNAFVKY